MNLNKFRIFLEGSEPDGVDCHSFPPDKGNGSSMEVESTLLLYSLVRRLRPLVICETGTNFGACASALALGLEDNWMDYRHFSSGYVFTVDQIDYPENEILWNRLGLQGFIQKVIGDSRTVSPPRNIDMLILDSDHDTDFVVEEWNHYRPFLNSRQSLVAVHDSRLDVRATAAMRIIVAQLESEGEQFGYVPLRNMRGLDLIQLRAKE